MSASKEKKHMSDQAQSGGPSEANAATAGTAPAASSSGTPAPAGSFGTAKGSGLSRGKRPSTASTPASSGNSGAYKPSALEVLRPQSEYKNPFTGETSVPAVNEPAPQAAPANVTAPSFAREATPAPAPAPAPAHVPAAAASSPSKESDGELFPFTPDTAAKTSPAPAAKAELNILPSEVVKRPAVSWGEPAAPKQGEPRDRRDERPSFQPERRERSFEPRQPRDPRENREGRDNRDGRPRDFSQEGPRRQDRPDRPAYTPRPAYNEPAKKPTGFIAWLKNLLGILPPEAPVVERSEPSSDDHHRQHRRRHRGGRGRGGYQGQGGTENRGPRDGQSFDRAPDNAGGNSHADGENSGEHRYEGGGGGGRRRRRRGGRGRYRDDRGPRPEGQQGGGAI
jgi:translation initiation factor IF-2